MTLRTPTSRLAVCVAALFLLAGCGGNDEPEPTPPPPPAAEPEPEQLEEGRTIFTQTADPTCSDCHTLADAGATGTIAPSLDDVQPSYDQVVQAVSTGPGVMPSYEGVLSDDEIDAVATYVSQVAGEG